MPAADRNHIRILRTMAIAAARDWLIAVRTGRPSGSAALDNRDLSVRIRGVMILAS